MNAQSEPVLLRVQEAAAMLAISRTVVYELVARGEIPTVHIGRAVRVPMAAVRAYADRLVADERQG